MQQPLSAVQIIYTGLNGPAGESEPGAVCRICGGPLLLPYKPVQKLSDSWTDENLIVRKDSDRVCRACAWFTEGKNRTKVWKGSLPVLYASEKASRAMTVPELYTFLRNDFNVPAVFIVRGRDPNLPRKHIQWRAMNAVTYNRANVKVLFYGLQLWSDKSTQAIGTAVFDADRMVETIDVMVEKSRVFVDALLTATENKKKKSKKVSGWVIQNMVMKELVEALYDVITTELYLAAYIASSIIGSEYESGVVRGA